MEAERDQDCPEDFAPNKHGQSHQIVADSRPSDMVSARLAPLGCAFRRVSGLQCKRRLQLAHRWPGWCHRHYCPRNCRPPQPEHGLEVYRGSVVSIAHWCP